MKVTVQLDTYKLENATFNPTDDLYFTVIGQESFVNVEYQGLSFYLNIEDLDKLVNALRANAMY